MSKWLVAAAVVFGSLACQPKEPWTSENPEFAARAFLTALAGGDRDTVWEFLDDESREFLTQHLAQSRALVGADLEHIIPDAPLQGLYQIWSPSAIDIRQLEVSEHTATGAVVLVHLTLGGQSELHLNRFGDRWVINLLDTPGGPPSQYAETASVNSESRPTSEPASSPTGGPSSRPSAQEP